MTDTTAQTDVTDQSLLTEEELSTLRRFLLAIDDVGVTVAMHLKVLAAGDNSSVSVEIFNFAIQDVSKAGLADIHEAGPSLQYVVEVAGTTGIFPEDFVPSKDTVKKIHSAFWENLRHKAPTAFTPLFS